MTIRRTLQPLTYPQTLFTESGEDVDYLSIFVLKYVPPGTQTNSEFRVRTGDQANRGTTPIGSIILPIPNEVSDNNKTHWKDSSMNSIAADAIDTAGKLIEDTAVDGSGGGVQAAKETISNVLNKYKQGIQSQVVRDSLEKMLLGKAVNVFGANVDVNDLISREEGVILNNNLELVFKAVQLRQFNYSFTFTPRTQSEGNTVKGIIKTFKRRMAPKSTVDNNIGGGGLFISAPDVFQLEFRKGGGVHPFLPKHKICALTNMQTNYTGTGAYATYYDGTPVNITLQLTFQELSPVYAEDYSDANDDGVGF